MRTLYLHIGMGKAGSSTIQAFLNKLATDDAEPRQIAAFGGRAAWKLAAASGTERARHYWVDHLRLLNQRGFDRLYRDIWEQTKRELRVKEATSYVASSEHISAHFANDMEAVFGLSRKLYEIFDNVTIIIYLREQVSWLKSFYCQRIKGPTRATESFPEFIGNLEQYRYLWDYYPILDMWARAFGERNLDVTVFDKNAFYRGDLIWDFAKKVGRASLANESNAYEVGPPANVSPGYSEIQLLRALNKMAAFGSRAAWGIPMGRAAVRRLGWVLPRAFPSNFDTEIRNRVSRTNKDVNARFLPYASVRLPE